MSEALTQDTLKKYLHYDALTGIFRRLESRSNRYKDGMTAGGDFKTKGYVCICVLGKRYRAHRLAWLYVYGRWPNAQIDHIDGNRSNNRLENLREATNSQNQQNVFSARSDSISGLKGAFKARDKWRAKITVDGKTYDLGIFNTAIEAHETYMKAKQDIHEYAQAALKRLEEE